jgi:gliding motility-associated-like protein
LPVINIHQKQALCKDQNDVLDAGDGFASYLWQDGSSRQEFKVRAPGTYWVSITDANNCSNSDTAHILSIVQTPANFIYADTVKCLYETISLEPYRHFASYLWNDGSTSPRLTVNDAGIYSLNVTDTNGCSGNAAIHVTQVVCPDLIYFPSAFTPNGDGKNDVFKPFIKGPVLKYELAVYNRWGQKIMSTTNPGFGWDGKLKGALEPNGVFVWICIYQFAGGVKGVKKGSVVLIR